MLVLEWKWSRNENQKFIYCFVADNRLSVGVLPPGNRKCENEDCVTCTWLIEVQKGVFRVRFCTVHILYIWVFLEFLKKT